MMLGPDPNFEVLRFFRITVLGASSSGKTSLVSSFVNNVCPHRCTPTENPVIYYRKVDLVSEEERLDNPEESVLPSLIEVEDTPGSDAVGDELEELPDASNPLKIRKGSRVTVLEDKNQVLAAFQRCTPNGRALEYKHGMDAMLGQIHTVKTEGKETFGLQSPLSAEVWDFPAAVLRPKLTADVPVDRFLHMATKQPDEPQSLKERGKLMGALQKPFAAFERPIGDKRDKTLTQQRMGFLVCFDVSDETSGSWKEALAVYQRLSQGIAEAYLSVSPIIWLVGCKADRSREHNVQVAKKFAKDENVRLLFTSARRHQRTSEVFLRMAHTIKVVPALWKYTGASSDDGNHNDEEAGGCSLT